MKTLGFMPRLKKPLSVRISLPSICPAQKSGGFSPRPHPPWLLVALGMKWLAWHWKFLMVPRPAPLSLILSLSFPRLRLPFSCSHLGIIPKNTEQVLMQAAESLPF